MLNPICEVIDEPRQFPPNPIFRHEIPSFQVASTEISGGRKKLTLADDELAHILRQQSEFKPTFLMGLDEIGNPMAFITELSDKIADEVVANVCNEMLSEDIINNLLNFELS